MTKESSCFAPSCSNEEVTSQQNKTSDDIRKQVRESYAKVAKQVTIVNLMA